MKKIILLISFLSLSPSFGYSQNYRLSGRITEKISEEPLIYATCYDSLHKRGVVSNVQGFYSISLPKGKNQLKFKYVGYKSKSISLYIQKDTSLSIGLDAVQLNEIEVKASAIPLYQQTLLGKNTIQLKTLQSIPGLSGIPDLNKALSFLPGVSLGKEGFSNLYVRGGDAGQNLIYLDGVKLYTSSHFGGLISLINTDNIKYIDFYKGGFPARFGGSLSSVIDIHTLEGNIQKKQAKLTVGTLISSFLLENKLPFIKDATFVLSARSSYLNIISPSQAIEVLKKKSKSGHFLNMADAQLKITKHFKNKGKLILNTFHTIDYTKAKDNLYDSSTPFESTDLFNNLSQIYQIKYLQAFKHRFFFSSSLSYMYYGNTNYYKNTSWQQKDIKEDSIRRVTTISQFNSNLRELNLKAALDWQANNYHALKLGIQTSHYTFQPNVNYYVQLTDTSAIENRETVGYTTPVETYETGLFIEDEIKFTEKTSLNIGIRQVLYHTAKTNFYFPEPRISFRQKLFSQWALKWNFSRMTQFHHELLKNEDGIITEIWLGATQKLPAEKAWQSSTGLFGRIGNWDISIESYYKYMTNLTHYKSYINSEENPGDIESRVESSGIGKSYGIEFSANTAGENYSVSINYTYSHSTRLFENLNNGKEFLFRYDRPHDLSLLFNYIFNKKYSINTNFILSSGTPFSLPVSYTMTNYFFRGYYNYGSLNNVRLPLYHRMDVSFSRSWISKKNKHHKKLNLSIYNVYARQNPVYLFYEPNTGKLYQKTLFTILPSLSYSINF